MHAERRKFLKNLVVISANIGLFSGSLSAATLGSDNSDRFDSNIRKELFCVYREWTKKYRLEPTRFLLDCGISQFTSCKQIRHLTRMDFATSRIININGLVLGKTEAAVIASLYEIQVKR